MAVTKVIANLSGDSTDLNNEGENTYSGNLTAPREAGNHQVDITARDDAGNIAIANDDIYVSKWSAPRINWKQTDRFNYIDYNRIKNNLEYLHEKAVELYKHFDVQDMGDDYISYEQYFYADQFNLFERNLEIINSNAFIQNFGESQTFYSNGVFIDYNELNRIENAILSIKTILDNQEAGLRRLPFRLGIFREVRI